MRKYEFKVPCYYYYEIFANNEDEAKKYFWTMGAWIFKANFVLMIMPTKRQN